MEKVLAGYKVEEIVLVPMSEEQKKFIEQERFKAHRKLFLRQGREAEYLRQFQNRFGTQCLSK